MRGPVLIGLACAAAALPAASGVAQAPTSSPSAAESIELVEELQPAPPTKERSFAARLVVRTDVRAAPRRSARKITTLQPFGTWNGGPVVLQIVQTRQVAGRSWLRVRLPIRPNGSTGWIPQDNTEVELRRYRILIERSKHRLTLFRDGKPRTIAKVVIGAPATPTPAGRFAVLEVVRQPSGSVLGPWALHLTAHSNVLDNYGGGPGRVALHGRSGSLLGDPLGSSRSHGCIRMNNGVISKLRQVAEEGTPVEIR